MNITKDNFLQLVDVFGKSLMLNPICDISWEALRKLDDIEYLKNNLDKPFTEYYDKGKRVVETLYEFIKTR